MTPLITLLTDFGLQDSFVGEMKGKIWTVCPESRIVDLSHELGAHDVELAAFAWKVSTASFPKGTIHVAVVDPGVGTSRRVLAAEIDGSYFVCPDNGLLSWILEEAGAARLVEADIPAFWAPQVSNTFHGRDIFAPLAAHIAYGIPIAALGKTVKDIIRLPIPRPRLDGNVIVGKPLLADRFGNLLTNMPNDLLDFAQSVEFAGYTCKQARSYADGGPGDILVIRGSHGYLEIALNLRSAKDTIPNAMESIVKLYLKRNAKT